MQLFGLGWLVVEIAVRDGTPALGPLYLGLVSASRAIPGMLFGLFGGVAADRFEARKLLILNRLASAAIATVLAAITILDVINLPWIMVLTMLSSIAFVIDSPTMQVILPTLVPGRSLLSAIGLTQTTFNVSMLLGPLIGGLLIVPFGLSGLMVCNALVCFAAATTLFALPSIPAKPATGIGVARSIGEGLVFVWRERSLRWVIGLSVLMSLAARPVHQLFPAVAKELAVGPVELSWLMGAAGAGTILGSLGSAPLSATRRRGIVLCSCVLSAGVLNILFAAQHSLSLAIAFAILPGTAAFAFSGMAYGVLQTRAPAAIRGRVISVYVTTIIGVSPLGTLAVGSLGSAIGVNLAITVAGTVCAAVGVYALLFARALRDLPPVHEREEVAV